MESNIAGQFASESTELKLLTWGWARFRLVTLLSSDNASKSSTMIYAVESRLIVGLDWWQQNRFNQKLQDFQMNLLRFRLRNWTRMHPSIEAELKACQWVPMKCSAKTDFGWTYRDTLSGKWLKKKVCMMLVNENSIKLKVALKDRT